MQCFKNLPGIWANAVSHKARVSRGYTDLGKDNNTQSITSFFLLKNYYIANGKMWDLYIPEPEVVETMNEILE